MNYLYLVLINLTLLTTSIFPCCAQDSIPRNTSKRRLITFGVSINTIYIGSLISLNEIWYKNEPRTSFHFFNDNHEWLQMDKMGHATTSFHESIFAIKALEWAGLSRKKAVWIGSFAGFVYQTPIELLDGYSPSYGASWGDIIANASGSGLVLGQYLLWDEVRIQTKFSFHQTSFASLRPQVLGGNLREEILKDYNGQTYWLSGNISSFIKNKESKFPKWINIAIGYGGENMIYADKNQNKLAGYDPYRQYYLSFDIDFSHVQTKRRWLKYVLYPLNIIHIPFPALEFNKHKVVFHPLYF